MSRFGHGDARRRLVAGPPLAPNASGPPRRVLYPEIAPYASGMLAAGGPHTLGWELCGRPEGKPAVVLHGGPGGAVNPTMRRFFDPYGWNVLLYDQRGCGRSLPNGLLHENDTWALVDDLERLREHVGVERWTVFGGSWGATLALAYAAMHPERVEALILRGVFLITEREVRWFYGPDGAAMLYPDGWQKFLAPIPLAERGDILTAYYGRLTHADPAIRLAAAQTWSRWEGDTMSIRGPDGRPDKFDEDEFSLAFARIECHYFLNRGFMPEDGWLLTQVDRFRGIPCQIVQGRFDVVTPAESAWRLKQAWPEAKLEIVWDAGHASTEPGIVDALIRATDAALRV